jgi:hypothetical protein
MTKHVWFWLIATAFPSAIAIVALDEWIGLAYGIQLALGGIGVTTFLLLADRYADART